MTLSIAYRNMRTGKARIAFSIAGVAVAVLLLSFILALYRGWNDGLGVYINETKADVWVAPRGSEGFFTPWHLPLYISALALSVCTRMRR